MDGTKRVIQYRTGYQSVWLLAALGIYAAVIALVFGTLYQFLFHQRLRGQFRTQGGVPHPRPLRVLPAVQGRLRLSSHPRRYEGPDFPSPVDIRSALVLPRRRDHGRGTGLRRFPESRLRLHQDHGPLPILITVPFSLAPRAIRLLSAIEKWIVLTAATYALSNFLVALYRRATRRFAVSRKA